MDDEHVARPSLSSEFNGISVRDVVLNARGRPRRANRMAAILQEEVADEELPANVAPPKRSDQLRAAIAVSRDPNLIGLLANLDEAAQQRAVQEAQLEAAADDAAAVDLAAQAEEGEAEERAAVPVGRGPASVRGFFTLDGDPDDQRGTVLCDLQTDLSVVGGQPHYSVITDDLTTLKNHLSSRWHKDAYAVYNDAIGNHVHPNEAVLRAKKHATDAAAARRSRTPWNMTPLQPKQRMLREMVFLAHVAKKGLSFASCDDDYLRIYHKIVQTAEPPSRKRLSDVVLPTLFEYVQGQRAKRLQDVDFFSLTFDAATSNSRDKFIAVTVHYTSEKDWELHSMLLDMFVLNESHTWQAVSQWIAVRVSETLPSYAVLVACVTDGAANMKKVRLRLMTNMEHDRIEQSYAQRDNWIVQDEELDALDETMSCHCLAHIAQLIALALQDDDRGLRDMVHLVKTTANAIRNSPNAVQELCKVQQAANRPKLMFLIDARTRWLTVVPMFERFVDLYVDYVALVVQGHLDVRDDADDPLPIITPANVDRIKRYLVVLKPLAEFVRLVEGEQYPTLEHAPVLLKRVMAAFQRAEGDDASMRALKARAMAETERRLGFVFNKPNLALAAAALSPWYCHLDFCTQEERNMIHESIRKWGSDWGDNKAGIALEQNIVQPGAIGNMAPRAPTEDDIGHELNHFLRCNSRAIVQGAVDADRRGILALAPSTVRGGLEYWKENHVHAKHVALTARIILSVPGTSAPSERQFFFLNFLMSHGRSSMSPTTAQRLAVVRDELVTISNREERAKRKRLADRDLSVNGAVQRDEEESTKREKMQAMFYDAAGLPEPE